MSGSSESEMADTPESPAETTLDKILSQLSLMRIRLNEVSEHNMRLESELDKMRTEGRRNTTEEEHRSTTSTIIHQQPSTSAQQQMSAQQPIGNTPVIVSECRDWERIPKFEAKTPASQPIQRNKEVDFWLRQIELRAKPTDAGRIHSARTSCQGNAELIINSALFDGVTVWAEFKQLVQRKFRGTASAAEFLSHLSKQRLREHQSPQDFHMEVETAVLSGARDYPTIMRDQEETIKGTFLQGLPGWLQQSIAVCNQQCLQDLVLAAQRVWIARQNTRPPSNTRYAAPTSSNALQLQQSEIPSSSQPANVSAASDDQPYCAYHRRKGHTTAACRIKPRGKGCWNCSSEEHIRRDCPFPAGQPGKATPPSADATTAGVGTD